MSAAQCSKTAVPAPPNWNLNVPFNAMSFVQWEQNVYDCNARPQIAEPEPPAGLKWTVANQSSRTHAVLDRTARTVLFHPYAKIQRAIANQKSRSPWRHSFEHQMFSPKEIAVIEIRKRRITYTNSIQDHIERLHAQLRAHNSRFILREDIEKYAEIEDKTVKDMLAVLEVESAIQKAKIAELMAAIQTLEEALDKQTSEFQDVDRRADGAAARSPPNGGAR